MSKSIHLLVTAFSAVCFLCGHSLHGQVQAEPTEYHKLLAEDVGTWDCEMKFWANGPDAEPMTAQGSEVNQMFGDYWLVSKFKGEFGGQEFEGRASLGYDMAKKKYVGTWFDTMSPYMSFMEGTYDEATKTMTMMTKGTGPDGNPSVGKNVTVTKADGTRVFSLYSQMPGGGDGLVKMMEIVYRKK